MIIELKPEVVLRTGASYKETPVFTDCRSMS